MQNSKCSANNSFAIVFAPLMQKKQSDRRSPQSETKNNFTFRLLQTFKLRRPCRLCLFQLIERIVGVIQTKISSNFLWMSLLVESMNTALDDFTLNNFHISFNQSQWSDFHFNIFHGSCVNHCMHSFNHL